MFMKLCDQINLLSVEGVSIVSGYQFCGTHIMEKDQQNFKIKSALYEPQVTIDHPKRNMFKQTKTT